MQGARLLIFWPANVWFVRLLACRQILFHSHVLQQHFSFFFKRGFAHSRVCSFMIIRKYSMVTSRERCGACFADLDKEMQEMDVEEKDAQKEYEQFTKDAAEKRVMDSKSVTEKEGAKADAEALLEKETSERTDKMKESLA